MKPQDFVIQFSHRLGDRWAVQLLTSPAGQATGTFSLRAALEDGTAEAPAGDAISRGGLAAPASAAERPPEELGARLFEALFSGEIRDRYQRSLGMVGADGTLRIQLRWDPRASDLRALHQLPWEYLYDRDTDSFLCLDRRTPITRYLSLPAPIASVPLPDRVRVLAIVASPAGVAKLDLGRECRRLEEACRAQPRIDLVFLQPATREHLRGALLAAQDARSPYHVLHFMGHGTFDEGTGEGALLLETADGARDPVTAKELRVLVHDFATLRLAFLNACQTGQLTDKAWANPFAAIAPALLLGGLPAVLAMRPPVTDDAAIAFSAAVYQRLAAGEPIDLAVAEGRLALYSRGRSPAEWATPVLYLRALDGRLFAEPGGTALAIDDYLNQLREACEAAFANHPVRPDRVHVPQRAASDSGEEVDLVEAMLGFWQGDHRRMAILGNYGMGKTYFAWKTVLDQAGRIDAARGCVPVLYPLRKFNHGLTGGPDRRPQDLVDQIQSHVQQLGFPVMARRELEQLVDDGRIGIILDGLDELQIPRDTSWATVVGPLAAIRGARFAITSRPAYIRSADKELAAYRVCHLLDWSDREWEPFVKHNDGRLQAVGGAKEFVGKVASRPQLAQLTSRPLWCTMMIEVAERIAQLADLDLSGLYQEFFDDAIRRRRLAHQLLSMTWCYCAMERVAEECIVDRRSSLSEPRVVELLSGLFETVGEPVLREYLTQEARTYAFLNCDRYRNYSFGHNSFESYFVAARIVRRFLAGQSGWESGPPERVPGQDVFLACDLTDDQVAFVAGILQQDRIIRSLGMLRDEAYPRLYAQVADSLRERLSSDDDPPRLRANLFRIIIALLRGGRPRLRRLHLGEVDLARLDLSGCDLEDIDFHAANLTGARFVGSSLARCRFHDAVIDAADFTDADLAGVDLRGIDLPRTPPRMTGVRNADRARLNARERQALGL